MQTSHSTISYTSSMLVVYDFCGHVVFVSIFPASTSSGWMTEKLSLRNELDLLTDFLKTLFVNIFCSCYSVNTHANSGE